MPTSLGQLLIERIRTEPFNAIASAIFLAAIVHTFVASAFTRRAHTAQAAHDAATRAAGRPLHPSVVAGILHFLGEVEVVFGLWAVVLLAAMTLVKGWHAATGYFNGTVNFTEPLFVVVIMAIASTRPVVSFAQSSLRQVARLGRDTPLAWWVTILVIGPLLGSFITEPAAMTLCALLLARKFYDLEPSPRLKYATIGLLFVNVSVGGTLTHFAAPPVLMVARAWSWNTGFVFQHLGLRAIVAIAISTTVYVLIFRKELIGLSRRPEPEDPDVPEDAVHAFGTLPLPAWLIGLHLAFLAWTVATAHYPALFIGGFLIFLGVANATSAYQTRMDIRPPLLVGFFLAGLVIHGGLQGWWIAPLLGRLGEQPLFGTSAVLTAFNDNALITYLATLVPNFSEPLKIAVVQGAVAGGGLTVIANAPNPAGQALLSRFFDGAVSPIGVLLAALVPTLIAAICFRAF